MKLTVVLLLTFLSFVTHAEDPSWKEKMRNVSSAMSEVIPFLYPSSDKDIKGLTEKVEKLYKASQALDVKQDHMFKTGDFDPALLYLSNAFKEDIERAYQSLKEGQTDYARYALKDSTSYCISCHTRNSDGSQFPLLKAFDEPLKSAPWIARMEFLTASRQFDAAFDQVLEEFKKPQGQGLSSLDLERGARLALSVAIRVKQDSKLALKLARTVQSSKNANAPTKQAAKDWERDILAWQKEKTKVYFTPAEVLKEAQRLINRAEKSQSQGHDEVSYLRATAILHGLLRKHSSSPEAPEALYLIGVSYTPLRDLGLWNLQERYFHACVLAVPHTELAEKCYQKFEESVVFGYSGSSGTHIPRQLQFQLQQLKKVAQEKKENL